jgi:tetratricopeptide (TPR) repeat protein
MSLDPSATAELKRAHRIRHDGIDLENQGKLTEAEAKYEEALALYRRYSEMDDLNYANAVRYPAVIKHRLGKFDESIPLWEEAVRRYEKLGITDGVIEGRRRLEEMKNVL